MTCRYADGTVGVSVSGPSKMAWRVAVLRGEAVAVPVLAVPTGAPATGRVWVHDAAHDSYEVCRPYEPAPRRTVARPQRGRRLRAVPVAVVHRRPHPGVGYRHQELSRRPTTVGTGGPGLRGRAKLLDPPVVPARAQRDGRPAGRRPPQRMVHSHRARRHPRHLQRLLLQRPVPPPRPAEREEVPTEPLRHQESLF